MPRGQTKKVTEIRTRGRKGGGNKDEDLSPPPQKKLKAVTTSKTVLKGRRKNHGTVSEDLDVESNKNEATEKLLDKVTVRNEALSENEDVRENVRASRKRKVENEATENIEGKIAEDKNITSKVPRAKKGRSESSSEKEDTSKESESKTKIISNREGTQEVGLRKTRNTRLSESFSSDAEKEVEKPNQVDIHTCGKLNKLENKHKNKSAKVAESYSSDGEKKSGQPLHSGEPRTQAVKFTRQTRNTRQTSNLSLDRENDLKQQDTTDTSTDTELLPEDEKLVSKTRYSRQTESLSSEGERDVKQLNATDISPDNEAAQQRAAGIRVTRYTRRTESLSSDGERDFKQQTDKKIVQQKLKGVHRTRSTRQTESSSSDVEWDNKQPNAVESFAGNIPIQIEKRVHKTRNMRTESLSSERETGIDQQQIVKTTVEEVKGGVKYTRETRSSRRSGSYSSDREKDVKLQSVKNGTDVLCESCSSGVDNCKIHAVDNDLENIVVVSNTNIEAVKDIERGNVILEKSEKTKSSSRTRRSKRIEDSSSDRENEKTETDKNLKSELEIELNKNEEKKDKKSETGLKVTAQPKQVPSNRGGENVKNKDRSITSDESINILNEIETDIELGEENENEVKLKTRNKGRNRNESHVQAVHNLSGDEEHKKGRKPIAAGSRTRKGITRSYPDSQDFVELNNVEVCNKIKENTSITRGRKKRKNPNEVEHEIDLEYKGDKEFHDKETIEETTKDADTVIVKTDAKKGKSKIYQHEKNREENKTQRKTRKTSKKETIIMESNEELLQDDLATNTHKTTTDKKQPLAESSKISEGNDLDSGKADDTVLGNKMDVNDSSNVATVESSMENETNSINFENEVVLEDIITNKVQEAKEVIEDTEPRGKFPPFTRGKRRRGRVSKLQVRGKRSTKNITKNSMDWKQNVSSITNEITNVENKVADDHLKGIADISLDTSKNNTDVCKNVSIVIKRLDLNDPLIYKLISDYDLEILKSGKENCDQHLKNSNVVGQIVVDENRDKPNEPSEDTNELEIINEQAANAHAVFENENKEEVEQINLPICLSNEIASLKDAQQLLSSDINSFNTDEMPFENAAEKETFDSIVERYVAENVNIGIIDSENTDFLAGELDGIDPLALDKFGTFDENVQTDHDTVDEKDAELNVNYTDDQESVNTEIDASENFSESILSTSLGIETVSAESNDLENVSPVVFSKNLDLQEPKVITILSEPGINDFSLVGDVNDDGVCENEELLEIEESNESEGETAIEFTDLKKSSESACKNSNSNLLHSMGKYDAEVKGNGKLNESLEISAASILENVTFIVSKTTVENVQEVEEKISGCVSENLNSNRDMYDENNEKCVDIFTNIPEGKTTEKFPENIRNNLEESLVENKSNRNSNSETLVDVPNELSNIKDHPVILPCLEESKLSEMGNKSYQSVEIREQNDETVLHTESKILEKVDSNSIVSAIENSRSMDADDTSVEMGLDVAECAEKESMHHGKENENTDDSVEVSNIDVDKMCSEKENTQMANVCMKHFASKLNDEVTSANREVSKSFSPSISLPEGNIIHDNLEDSLLDDSAEVPKELNEEIDNIAVHVNETFMSCDGTTELLLDKNIPVVITEKIEVTKAKIDLFPEGVQSEIKSIGQNDKDTVKEFVNSTKASEPQDSIKHVREKELHYDRIAPQIGTGCDSATNHHYGKDIERARTNVVDTSLVTEKCKSNGRPPKMKKKIKNNASSEKCTEKFSAMRPSVDISQPGPSSVSSHSKKSAVKPQGTQVQLSSVPRWPRMLYAPVRIYLEQFVPLLLEGLLCLSSVRPDNPVQYLARWMEMNKADTYYRMKHNIPKRSKGQINSTSDGKKQGR